MAYVRTGFLGQDDLMHNTDSSASAAAAMEAAMEPDPNAAMLKFSAPVAQPAPQYNYDVPTTPAPTKPKAVARSYVAPRSAAAVTPAYIPPPPPSKIKPWMWIAGAAAAVGIIVLVTKH